MPTLPDRPLARGALPIDGVLPCWRCDEPVDEDGYCSACGAVTIADDDEIADITFGRLPAGQRRAAAVADGCEVDELA